MNFDFDLLFVSGLMISGLIILADTLFRDSKGRKGGLQLMPVIVNHARSFFPILLLVFSVRSFGYEPRLIPSGSLKPTLLVGDYILVNKFNYGIRLPVVHTKIFSLNEPQRGDIVVFREPPDESRDLIKRVIGLPGDHITYKNKILYVNGKEISQQFVQYTLDQRDDLPAWDVVQKHEYLLGLTHDIYQNPQRENEDFDVTVPQGKYFMMGDNRDDSADSRYWGFLPEENIVGQATQVLVSFDSLKHPLRGDRIMKEII
jgi:signal peptidase I